jgi:hypothetical protein
MNIIRKFSYILEECEEKSLYGTSEKQLVYMIHGIDQETILEVKYCLTVGIMPVLKAKLSALLEEPLELNTEDGIRFNVIGMRL